MPPAPALLTSTTRTQGNDIFRAQANASRSGKPTGGRSNSTAVIPPVTVRITGNGEAQRDCDTDEDDVASKVSDPIDGMLGGAADFCRAGSILNTSLKDDKGTRELTVCEKLRVSVDVAALLSTGVGVNSSDIRWDGVVAASNANDEDGGIEGSDGDSHAERIRVAEDVNVAVADSLALGVCDCKPVASPLAVSAT